MSTIVPMPNIASIDQVRSFCSDPRGNRRVRRDLHHVAREVARDLGDDLQAILLVGSYARGEGGVVMRAGEIHPHNDYDLVVVLRRWHSGQRSRVARSAKRWSEALSIDVDMWPMHVDALRSLPRTLFWLDVSMGGAIVLAGEMPAQYKWPALGTRDLPLDEAARLLTNRATGLALSNLEGISRDRLRTMRHVHKAVQACADARLLAADRYRATLAERRIEIKRMAPAPGMTSLAAAYAQALAFRNRPDLWNIPRNRSLEDWYQDMVGRIERWHMTFEAERIGCSSDPLLAAEEQRPMFPHASDLRKLAAPIAAARAALARRSSPLPYLGHPREALARVAMILAYRPHDERARRTATRLLGGRPTSLEPFTADELHRRLSTLIPFGS